MALMVMGGAVVSAHAKNKKDAVPQLFCQAQYVWVQTVNGDPLNPNVVPEDRTAANALIAQLQGWKRYVVVKDPQQADLVWVVRTGRAAKAGAGSNGGSPGSNGNAGGGANQDENPGGMGAGGLNAGGMNSGGAGGMNPGAAGPGSMNRNGQGGLSGPGGMSPGSGMGADGNNGRAARNSNVGAPNDILAIYQRPNGEPLTSPLWQKTERNGLEGTMPLFDKIRSAVDATCAEAPAAGPK